MIVCHQAPLLSLLKRLNVGVQALVDTRWMSPCSISCVSVGFNNGALLLLFGEQPIVLAAAYIAWGSPWAPFGQQFNLI